MLSRIISEIMNKILLYHFSEKYYTQDPQNSCDFVVAFR